MNKEILIKTVNSLGLAPKGILAMDESSNTCNPRFEKLGIPATEENRRNYREILITTPELEKYISGAILHDETIRQTTKEGKSFVSLLKEKGIEIGIKVDLGLKDFEGHEGEKISQGLEGLSLRMKEYKEMGASFAKWRTVYSISDKTPSEDLMKNNAETLAEYALVCQENDIVPIIEPEVLINGNHSIEKCYEVMEKNFKILFEIVKNKGVFIPGIILKTSMVISGKDATERASTEKVAEMTVKCLKENVPNDIGAIVFLSGGQEDEEATLNLNAMHQLGTLPWPLTFSYSRAIQNPVLKNWAKNMEDVASTQKILFEMSKRNGLASIGEYQR